MKNRSIVFLSLLVLAMGGILLSAQSAQAGEGTVKIGVLRCDVAGGLSFIFGSTRELECIYSPGDSKRSEKYTGEISKFGVDIGYVESGVIIWTVLAPTSKLGPGALSGTYVGASADVAAGLGLGANALVGGGESISLQPLSFTGAKGLNIAAGLSKLELKESE
jgi:hypothetical protein